MNAHIIAPTSDDIKARNLMAAVLSIVPGLGHIYKGHTEAGLFWLFLGTPVVIFIAILLGLATAGFGLFLPMLWWAALAVDAYYETNRRDHHWLPPQRSDYE